MATDNTIVWGPGHETLVVNMHAAITNAWWPGRQGHMHTLGTCCCTCRAVPCRAVRRVAATEAGFCNRPPRPFGPGPRGEGGVSGCFSVSYHYVRVATEVLPGAIMQVKSVLYVCHSVFQVLWPCMHRLLSLPPCMHPPHFSTMNEYHSLVA